MARSWTDLGLMQGTPPPLGGRVTLANYDHDPNPRWSVINTRELIPSARVAASTAPTTLPRRLRDQSELTFEHAGVARSIEGMLSETQQVLVHPPSQTVIAKFSSRPRPHRRRVRRLLRHRVRGDLRPPGGSRL